jgi:hypothetical protein
MKKRMLFASVALIALSVLAYAQGAGTWTGEAQGRGGAQMVTVVLNADGSGTFKQGEGEPQALSDVMLEGNSVSFKRMFSGRGGEITLAYSGEVDGNTMTLDIAFEGGGFGGGGGGGGRGGRGGPQQLVLTRAN